MGLFRSVPAHLTGARCPHCGDLVFCFRNMAGDSVVLNSDGSVHFAKCAEWAWVWDELADIVSCNATSYDIQLVKLGTVAAENIDQHLLFGGD